MPGHANAGYQRPFGTDDLTFGVEKADRGDGWFFYHLPADTLESFLADWRSAAGEKPYAMAVRTELRDDVTGFDTGTT